jgi:hypothetical protein
MTYFGKHNLQQNFNFTGRTMCIYITTQVNMSVPFENIYIDCHISQINTMIHIQIQCSNNQFPREIKPKCLLKFSRITNERQSRSNQS